MLSVRLWSVCYLRELRCQRTARRNDSFQETCDVHGFWRYIVVILVFVQSTQRQIRSLSALDFICFYENYISLLTCCGTMEQGSVGNNNQTHVCFLSLVTHPCIVTVLSGTRCRPSTIRAWIAARAPATTRRRLTRRPVGAASAWAEVDRRSTRQPMRGHRDSRDSARKNQRKCLLAALHLAVNLWCTRTCTLVNACTCTECYFLICFLFLNIPCARLLYPPNLTSNHVWFICLAYT